MTQTRFYPPVGGVDRSTRPTAPPTLDKSVVPVTDRDREMVAMADTARTDTGRSAGAIMSSPPPRNWRPWIYAITAAVVATAAVITIVLIAGNKSTPAPGPQTPAPKAKPTPAAEAAAANGAIVAYRGYATVVDEAPAGLYNADPRLGTYVGGRLFRETAVGLLNMKLAGITSVGRIRYDVHATDVSLATQTVQLAGCNDASQFHFIVKATGKVADAPGQPKRFRFTAVAQFQNGRWLITAITPLKGQAC